VEFSAVSVCISCYFCGKQTKITASMHDAVISVCCRRATTHADLLLRAREQGVGTKVIHNTSIINAVGCCGLQVCD